MTSPGRLAEYLRARRERLKPQDVGIAVTGGTRRVTGLRRDEVAILAGISTAYYLRLEQGRDRNPSDQVLDALARALRLDPAGAGYLRRLARPAHLPTTDAHDVMHDSTRWLIDSWPHTAAVVHSRYLDVLASNSLARALNPNFRPGVNSVTVLFTDPSESVFHADWEGLAGRSVALLRGLADPRHADARLDAVVAEGIRSSAKFREFWERHDVVRVGDGTHLLRHPIVGELTLCFFRLPLMGTNGQSIFLYTAEPGTASAAALESLAAAG
jgi:transcriptional regulator with XRE-family HTH domain